MQSFESELFDGRDCAFSSYPFVFCLCFPFYQSFESELSDSTEYYAWQTEMRDRDAALRKEQASTKKRNTAVINKFNSIRASRSVGGAPHM